MPRCGSVLLAGAALFLSGCCTTREPALSTAPVALVAVMATPEPDVAEPPRRQRSAAQTREAMMVRSIQASLVRLGYETGSVDGVAGPRTRAAIRQYQENNGLEADGEPTPRLVADLKTRL